MIALGYTPKAFITMTLKYGTAEAVKRLIGSTGTPKGFITLREMGRLDLSMENIIQEAEWKNIFSDDERERRGNVCWSINKNCTY